MTDFTKTKIAFALAMVGVLFAIHSIIKDFGSAGYDFFGLVLKVQFFYFGIVALLGGAVYFYAIDFITERPIGMAHKIGNFLYALSLFVPPLYLILWFVAKVANLVAFILKSSMAGNVSQVLLTLIGAIFGAIVSWMFSAAMNRKDRLSRVDQLATQEGAHLQRAEEMLKSDHYDLAALEAFRAVETALRRAFVDSEIRVRSHRPVDVISNAAKVGIIPADIVGTVQEVRVARNNAVHGSRPVSKEKAQWLVDTTKEILSNIRVPRKKENEDEDNDSQQKNASDSE